MFAVALYNIAQDRRREEGQAAEDATRLASLIALEEKRLFDQTRTLLAGLSHHPDVARPRATCPAVLAQALEDLHQYDNIFVIERDGSVSCSAVPPREPVNVADRDYFRQVLDGADFAFGSYEQVRMTGKPGLVFAYPVAGPTEGVDRVLAAAVNLDRLAQFEQEVSRLLTSGATLAKVDREARVLSHTPHVPGLVGTIYAPLEEFKRQGGVPSSTVRRTSSDGVDRLFAVARVPSSLQAGTVSIILGIPVGVAFAAVQDSVQRTFLILAALTLLIVATTWLVTVTTVGRPLRGLLSATRQMAAGAYDLRLAGQYGAGEFGDLARSVDEMAAAVQAREQAVAASEARYRSLFENAPYGIAMASAQGRLLEVNPACAATLGFETAGDLVGSELLARVVTAEEGQQLLRQLRSDGEVRGADVRLVRRDGRPILARVAGRVLSDPGRQSTQYQFIVEDVTQQRQLEEQHRQGQRMEAIGRLAGGVAHDFNNLLTVILGYADLMPPDLAPAAGEKLEGIRKAARSAQSLTQQLLAFSRRQLMTIEPLALNQVVDGAQKLLRRLIGEDIQLAMHLAPDLALVEADRGQVEQVVLNLAVNARDAMPEGGVLIIETRNEEVASPVTLDGTTMPAGRYVALVVRDTGLGMTPATMERIFEPFFTTKGSGQGTGLGMATVYGIVKQTGGFIRVESEPGRGATFTIYFPPSTRPAAAAPRREPGAPAQGIGGRLLLVEDDDAVREVSRLMLASAGYQVHEAATGEQAVELLQRLPGPIDLVITDVVLPGMSGPDLARHLAASFPTVPVLYTSGYIPDTAVRLLRLEPAAELLPKPYTTEALLRRVRELLTTRR